LEAIMEKRTRSPNYPALSLPVALDKVAALYKKQHTHAAPREVVAQGMGYNSLNGASATAISALHKYGLLDKVGDEVKISDRAMRILHPHSPEEKAAAIKDAAMEPALFAELAERFPGVFPSDEILRNFLIRGGFAPAAVSSVILAYRDTVELAEREGGGYGGSRNLPAIREIDESMNAPTSQPFSPASADNALKMQPNERPLGRYDFEGGGYVRIIAGGHVDTEAALDMAETLLQLKRKEIRARNASSSVMGESSEDSYDL
jgi:hypothetical protein